MFEANKLLLTDYFNFSLKLVDKKRKGTGNMYRHQVETFAILLEYGYTDTVLLKASLIHDIIEDIPSFNTNEIIEKDQDGKKVADLVQEVSIKIENGVKELKSDFLLRIMERGTRNAKVLKLADRLSNVTSLYRVYDMDFVKKYIIETQNYIIPFSKVIDERMGNELINELERLIEHYKIKI